MRAADLILHNGKVVTLDDAGPAQARAVAVTDGTIAAVGADSEILARRGPETRLLDAGGRAVVPGLTDGHAHMDREGLKEVPLSLAGVDSIAALQARLAEAAAARPAGAWIVTMPLGRPPAYAGDPARHLAEGRLPTRHDLDEAAPDNPVYIRAPWGYWRPADDDTPLVSVANSAALARSGIGRDTPAPLDHVEIERDARGAPTGVFREPGPVLVVEMALMAAETRFSEDDRVAGLARSVAAYAAAGTTAVFEGHGVAPDVLAAYRRLHDRGRLDVRARLVLGPSWPADGDIAGAMADWYRWAAGRGWGDDRLAVAGLYGRPGRTARDDLLTARHPYTGWAGYSHDAAMPPALFREFALEAARQGMRVATLFPDALDIFAEADRVAPIGELRWVIGHIGTLDADQIARIRDLGIVLTLHTNRSIADTGARAADRLGPEAAWQIVPARTLTDHGVPFALSSDNHPVSLFGPIWHCVAREHPATGRRIAPEQALDRREALAAAARGGAYLTREEDRRGRIAPGLFADMAVLSGDPLTCPEAELPDISAVTTIVGGRVVHDGARTAREAV